MNLLYFGTIICIVLFILLLILLRRFGPKTTLSLMFRNSSKRMDKHASSPKKRASTAR